MFTKRDKNEVRKIRHERVRKKVSGTNEVPRLCVYRSVKHIYAQVIDDTKGTTLVSDKKGAAKLVGKTVGERALQAGFKTVVFDRGGYLYSGRVQSLAEGAREAGLEF